MIKPIRVKRLQPNAILPTYGTVCAAGADLYACLDAPVVIQPGQTVVISTGVAMEIPDGYVGLVFARSGLATREGLAPATKVGVIDSDYRGAIQVCLLNHGQEARTVSPADRIAQIVITPYITGVFQEADTLSATERGTGGFGSTGK